MSWVLFWQLMVFMLLGMVWSLMLASALKNVNGKKEKL